ncbi:hypothetical protein KIPB_005293, partial [Kipferlia bialata]
LSQSDAHLSPSLAKTLRQQREKQSQNPGPRASPFTRHSDKCSTLDMPYMYSGERAGK